MIGSYIDVINGSNAPDLGVTVVVVRYIVQTDILELVLNRRLEEQDLFKLMIIEYQNHDLSCLARDSYSICFLSTEHIQNKLNQTVCGLRDDTRKTLMHSVRS